MIQRLHQMDAEDLSIDCTTLRSKDMASFINLLNDHSKVHQSLKIELRTKLRLQHQISMPRGDGFFHALRENNDNAFNSLHCDITVV